MDRLLFILLLTNSMLNHFANVNGDKQLCDKEVEGNGIVHISVSSNTNCVPTHLCTEVGGHCFTSGSKCNGKIDAYGCIGAGMRCMCCIPSNDCPGVCPHHSAPICAAMNNGSKLETFSNNECFKEKVKCDPAFANYTFEHEGKCEEPMTSDSTKSSPTTPILTTKAQTRVSPTSMEHTTKEEPMTSDSTKRSPTTQILTTKSPTTVSPTTMEHTTKGCCPDGLFAFRGQCFRFINHRRYYDQAKAECKASGLELAQPDDDSAISLRAHLTDNYSVNICTFVGGRGDGSQVKWERSGEIFPKDSPLWIPGNPGSRITTDNILALATEIGNEKPYPNQPYFMGFHSNWRCCILCELPRD